MKLQDNTVRVSVHDAPLTEISSKYLDVITDFLHSPSIDHSYTPRCVVIDNVSSVAGERLNKQWFCLVEFKLKNKLPTIFKETNISENPNDAVEDCLRGVIINKMGYNKYEDEAIG